MSKIKITRYGFIQAMQSPNLFINTLSDEMVTVAVKNDRLRCDAYCKHVKITIEEISEEEYIQQSNYSAAAQMNAEGLAN